MDDCDVLSYSEQAKDKQKSTVLWSHCNIQYIAIERYGNLYLSNADSNLSMWFWRYKVKVAQSCPILCDSMDCPWNSPGQNTGADSHSLLQRIFPTQGSNPGLLHWRWILYQLSHHGSPRILEWVAYPFSRGSFQPRNQTGVSCIAGGFFTSWATREERKCQVKKWSDYKKFSLSQADKILMTVT